MINRDDYPELFQEKVWPWGPTRVVFELDDAPPEALISNVNIVPYVDEEWLIIRTENGWGITGGTLEPDETYQEAIVRELREEAGVRLKQFILFGAWHCYSEAEQPYRPHLPWPEFYRVVGYGEVALIGEPENPPGGEEVLEVGVFPLAEACRRLRQRPDDGIELAQIYQLAAAMRARHEHG